MNDAGSLVAIAGVVLAVLTFMGTQWNLSRTAKRQMVSDLEKQLATETRRRETAEAEVARLRQVEIDLMRQLLRLGNGGGK